MFDSIRTTLSKTRWVHVAIASTAVVNIGAFSMSVVALTDLAATHGVPEWQSWVLPIVLEGLVLAATAGTVSLSGKKVLYPWVLMILSMLTSAAGNVVHAYLGANQVISINSIVAMVVAGIPPLFLLLSTHLTVMLVNDAKPVASQIVAVETALVAEPQHVVEPVVAPVPEPVTAVLPIVAPTPVHEPLVGRPLTIVSADKGVEEIAPALATA